MLNKLTNKLCELEKVPYENELFVEAISEDGELGEACGTMTAACIAPIVTSGATVEQISTPKLVDPILSNKNTWDDFEKEVLATEIPENADVERRRNYLTDALDRVIG